MADRPDMKAREGDEMTKTITPTGQTNPADLGVARAALAGFGAPGCETREFTSCRVA